MTARTVWSLSFPERLELQLLQEGGQGAVSYTHLTLPTTPYV